MKYKIKFVNYTYNMWSEIFISVHDRASYFTRPPGLKVN